MMEDKGTRVFNRYMRRDMYAIGFYGRKMEKAVYADMLTQLAAIMIKRTTEDHYQNVVVIEGRTGSGKSTLAVQLAKLIDPTFDVQEDLAYSADDWDKKLDKFRRGRKTSKVTLLDEGTVTFNGKNSLRKDDKRLVVMLQIMRSLNWTTIICVPRFADLNRSVRTNLVDYRIICPERPLISKSETVDANGNVKTVRFSNRGFFEVYTPRYDKFHDDDDSIFWWLIGAGVFGDLDRKTKEAYEKSKLDHQFQWFDDNIKAEKAAKAKAGGED